MDTARLFRNGQSQAIRLPKQYAFKGTEVFVKQIGGIVMLIPKNSDPWKPFVESLDKFSADFMKARAQQSPRQNWSMALPAASTPIKIAWRSCSFCFRSDFWTSINWQRCNMEAFARVFKRKVESSDLWTR